MIIYRLWLVFFAFSALFIQCANNVQGTDTATYLELESVWQYLKIYSIYQDECRSGSGPDCQKRLDENPYSYESPPAMMDSLYDTLKGMTYTRYEPQFEREPTPSIPDASLLSSASNQSKTVSDSSEEDTIIEDDPGPEYFRVSFDSLTPSTVLIGIFSFDRGYSYREFSEVLQRITPDVKNVILDLRDNGGGDLKELDSIIELIIPEGKEFILVRERAYDTLSSTFKTFDFHPRKTIRPAHTLLEGRKFVVLMNKYTASSSEVLVAALKDGTQAVLAGETTYGKAIGQIHINRRGHRNLLITFIQFKGASFGEYQNTGIQPDVFIETDDEKEYLHKALTIVEPGISINAFNFPQENSLSKRADWKPRGYQIIDENMVPLPEQRVKK